MTYYSNLAAVYMEMKDYDAAIEQCDKVMALSKEGSYDFIKLGKALARKGSALFQKGLLDEAIAVYKVALLEHNDYNIKEALKKVQKAKNEEEARAYINPELAE